MREAFIFAFLTMFFTLLFFTISAYLRCRKNIHSHLIHWHHAYFGIIIFAGLGIGHFFSDFTLFLLSLAFGLILSDLIHHVYFHVPIRWNQ